MVRFFFDVAMHRGAGKGDSKKHTCITVFLPHPMTTRRFSAIHCTSFEKNEFENFSILIYRRPLNHTRGLKCIHTV